MVDESALRYFARQGDQRRLDAEIARLRALYPDWVPPADPTAPEIFVDPELDQFWLLFSEGKYAEVRSGIAERRAREPEWEPPAALIELLDQADARIRLTNASNAKQWKTVVDIAAETPSLLTCAYVDVLWRVAEAFANTERMPRAKDVYVYILTSCNDPGERLATVQKAADILPEADFDALLVYEREGEFGPVKDTILRRRVGVTAENPELTSTPEDLARIEALAADEGNAADALLLGWYYYRHKDAGRALDWFDKARKRDPASAKAVEGYTLSLIELDRFADAETASYDWNQKSEDNLAAYLIAAVGLLATDPPLRIAEPVLARMAEVIVRVKSLQGGEQLGWYAYNLGQVKTAVRWFETVRRWDPNYEPAAYGLAVARWALKDRAGVNAIIREWGDRSERIANIGKPVRAELRGSTAGDRRRGRRCRGPADAERRAGRLCRDRDRHRRRALRRHLCRARGAGRDPLRRLGRRPLRERRAGALALARVGTEPGVVPDGPQPPGRGGHRLRNRAPLDQRQDPAGRRLWRVPRQSPLGRHRPCLACRFGRADVAEAPGRADVEHPRPAGDGCLRRRPLCRDDPRPR